MDTSVKAIPTEYRGRLYRSRLEARWAAFFDLLNWRVEYEPCDFNGWIPDFVILGAEQVYVEVKPIGDFDERVAKKIDASSCPSEVVLVGYSLPRQDYGHQLGWLRYGPFVSTGGLSPKPFAKPEWDWGEAPLGVWHGEDGKGNPGNVIGFCHAIHTFSDRITGLYDGGCYGHGDGGLGLQLWQEAGNATQWRSPEGRTR